MMNLDTYQELTGLTVSSSREGLISAQIRKTQRMLEALLGYTLDPDLIDTNYYEETGISISDWDCSCCTDDDPDLNPPDEVIFAYRLFPYYKKDKYLHIDPASEIYAVKLVKNGVTFRVLEESEYRIDYDRGIIRFLEQVDCWCTCVSPCNCVQLAVDAQWLWPDDEIPEDLLDIWCEMVTYYGDRKRGIKSETLGPHSYTKFDNPPPQEIDYNSAIIQRYAGPLGTATKQVTL